MTASGAQLEIRGRGLNISYQPLNANIAAVAIAPGGGSVLVGDTLGEAAVIDLRAGYAQAVVDWTAPDSSPVTAVGWDDGPVVTTRSGQSWRLQDCQDCATNAGLMAAFRARFTGCMSARQLAFIGDGTWSRLGLRECADSTGEPAQLGGS